MKNIQIIKKMVVGLFFISSISGSYSQESLDPEFDKIKAICVDYKTFKKNYGNIEFYRKNDYSLNNFFKYGEIAHETKLTLIKRIKHKEFRDSLFEHFQNMTNASRYMTGEPSRNTYELFLELIKYYETLSKYYTLLDDNENERERASYKYNMEIEKEKTELISKKQEQINKQISILEKQIDQIENEEKRKLENIDQEISNIENSFLPTISSSQYDDKIAAVDQELNRLIEQNREKEQSEIKALSATNFSSNKQKIQNKYLSIINSLKKTAQDKKEKLAYEKSLANESISRKRVEQQEEIEKSVQEKLNEKNIIKTKNNTKIEEIRDEIKKLRSFNYEDIIPSKPIFDDSEFTTKNIEYYKKLNDETSKIKIRLEQLSKNESIIGGVKGVLGL